MDLQVVMFFTIFVLTNSFSRRSLSFSFGEPPQVKTDTIGQPLNTEDFRRAVSIPDLYAPHEIPSASPQVDHTISAGYYQGDIILENEQEYDNILQQSNVIFQGNIRNAILNLTERWPNAIIPYVISSYYNETQRAKIAAAIIAIHNNTCIRFVPKADEVDYLHILNAYTCSSRVGRKGGRQTISFGPNCLSLGIMIHEFMHTMGFWHEHSRWDRDEFIDIFMENVGIGRAHNFDKLNITKVQTLGVDYDYGSVLHYGPYAFSRSNYRPTIIPKKNVEIGQRRFFSKKDIYKINLLYGCQRDPHTTSSCVDSHEKCWIWGVLGECKRNPQWMKFNCPRSCEICGRKTRCMDRNFFCSSWAAKGECDSNKKYMQIYCSKSCNVCSYR